MSESDYVLSPMGQAVSKAVSAQNKLKDSVADTLDATYNFGYEVGAIEAEERIIKLLEKYEVGGSDPVTFEHIPHEELMARIKERQNEK